MEHLNYMKKKPLALEPYRGSEFIELVESTTNTRARQNASGWMCQCPAPEDDSPSLSVREKPEKLLLNCFAGCNVKDICDSLGISVSQLFYTKDIRPRRTKYEREQKETDKTIVWLFDARRSAGTPLETGEKSAFIRAKDRLKRAHARAAARKSL